VTTSNIFLLIGVFVLSQALRSTRSVLLHKLGVFGHVGASFLLGYFLTDSMWGGLFFASFWFVWPWYELITRVKKIAMPTEKTMRHKSPPHREQFPALDEITEEIETEGFEHVEDLGRDIEEVKQFNRIFYKADERTQASVCLMEQERFAFYYIRITSHGSDGRMWITWNYPFSLQLKLATGWTLNRQRGDLSFIQLLQSHQEFLTNYGLETNQLKQGDPEMVIDDIQHEQQVQIAHNLIAGILEKQPDGAIRYTWRGLLFIWLQFLRDFVRLS